MSISHIEHIGIAVKDLAEAEEKWAKLLNTLSYKRELVESEGVITSFFKVGETKIELLAPTTANSPIQRFLDKRGEGIHHIAFAVDNIEAKMKELANQGFTLINETPKKGADRKKVAFLHPKSTGGILVELCQDL